jgi:PAS domain S-box-containing protein
VKFDPQVQSLEQALRRIEEGVASATSERFFRLLTRRLAENLQTRWSFVSEVRSGEGNARLVALWTGHQHEEGRDYAFGNAWTDAFRNGLAFLPSSVSTQMSQPEWLTQLDAESLLAVPLFTDDGLPVGWLGVLDDRPMEDANLATAVLRTFAARTAAELQRQQIEAALRASEERYRQLVEGSPDGIFRVRFDPEWKLEYANEACARIVGVPLEELQGASADYIQQFWNGNPDNIDDVIAGREVVPAPLRHWNRPDGSEAWTEGRNLPTYGPGGRLTGYVGILRDVTARELALRDLRDLEESERRVLAALPDVALRLDRDGRCIEQVVTSAARRDVDPAGKRIEDLVPAGTAQATRQAFARALHTHRVERLRYEEHDHGADLRFEIRFVPMAGNDLLALIRDVTAEEWAALEPRRQDLRQDLEGRAERKVGASNPYDLTFRELVVLQLLVKGVPDKQIAADLAVSSSTASKHVSNILSKMDAASRTEASVRAVQEGLV